MSGYKIPQFVKSTRRSRRSTVVATRPLTFAPPSRVWVQGSNGLWSSRQWAEGEKSAYSKSVVIPVFGG